MPKADPKDLRFGERPLTPGETRLARGLFGDRIDLDRVRIVRRRRGRFAYVIGSRIHFPPGPPADFRDAPVEHQAWLMHELTHVWQFQTQPFRTLWSWLGVLLGGGYSRGLPGYRYALPLRPFREHNLEQQARIVQHVFLLSRGARCPTMPPGASLAHYQDTAFLRQALDSMDKADDPADA